MSREFFTIPTVFLSRHKEERRKGKGESDGARPCDLFSEEEYRHQRRGRETEETVHREEHHRGDRLRREGEKVGGKEETHRHDNEKGENLLHRKGCVGFPSLSPVPKKVHAFPDDKAHRRDEESEKLKTLVASFGVAIGIKFLRHIDKSLREKEQKEHEKALPCKLCFDFIVINHKEEDRNHDCDDTEDLF